MKVLLICSTGISTHAFSRNLEEKARKKGVAVDLTCLSAEMAMQNDQKADHILLAPQIRFNYQKIASIFKGVPVDVIDAQAFGQSDPDPVFKLLGIES